MEPQDKKYGKGLIIGSLLAAGIAAIMKLLDRHFEKKEK